MKICGQADEQTIAQMECCIAAEDGAIGVLCADNHLGYSAPIGSVVAYKNNVSVSGVGYDIACGNLAVKTDIRAKDIDHAEFNKIADEINSRISFGIGRKNNEPVDSPVFDSISRSPVMFQRSFLEMSRGQLGTVGSGNHYVDILEDKKGILWIATHFGSRGFGYKTATAFMNLAKGEEWDAKGRDGEMNSPPLLLDINTPTGQDYIEAMKIAGEYAYEGREKVVEKVLDIMGGTAVEKVHNHHNFAWLERHGGEDRWVVRKGATPAQPGQLGFVGGSMGDISVILRGVESPESANLLYSTVHGAGRVMSRTQAAGKQKFRKEWKCLDYRNCKGSLPSSEKVGVDGENPKCPLCGHKTQKRSWMERVKPGVVDFQTEYNKLKDRGIILRGAGADECPLVYRPLEGVLDAHKGTIEVIEVFQPRVVVMAGSDVFDPFKDG